MRRSLITLRRAIRDADPETLIAIAIAFAVLTMLLLLRHFIVKQRYVPRLLTAWTRLRMRTHRRYRRFVATLRRRSRVAALFLPHLLFFAVVALASLLITPAPDPVTGARVAPGFLSAAAIAARGSYYDGAPTADNRGMFALIFAALTWPFALIASFLPSFLPSLSLPAVALPAFTLPAPLTEALAAVESVFDALALLLPGWLKRVLFRLATAPLLLLLLGLATPVASAWHAVSAFHWRFGPRWRRFVFEWGLADGEYDEYNDYSNAASIDSANNNNNNGNNSPTASDASPLALPSPSDSESNNNGSVQQYYEPPQLSQRSPSSLLSTQGAAFLAFNSSWFRLYLSPALLAPHYLSLLSLARLLTVTALIAFLLLAPVTGSALLSAAEHAPLLPLALIAWLQLPVTDGAALLCRVLAARVGGLFSGAARGQLRALVQAASAKAGVVLAQQRTRRRRRRVAAHAGGHTAAAAAALDGLDDDEDDDYDESDDEDAANESALVAAVTAATNAATAASASANGNISNGGTKLPAQAAALAGAGSDEWDLAASAAVAEALAEAVEAALFARSDYNLLTSASSCASSSDSYASLPLTPTSSTASSTASSSSASATDKKAAADAAAAREEEARAAAAFATGAASPLPPWLRAVLSLLSPSTLMAAGRFLITAVTAAASAGSSLHFYLLPLSLFFLFTPSFATHAAALALSLLRPAYLALRTLHAAAPLEALVVALARARAPAAVVSAAVARAMERSAEHERRLERAAQRRAAAAADAAVAAAAAEAAAAVAPPAVTQAPPSAVAVAGAGDGKKPVEKIDFAAGGVAAATLAAHVAKVALQLLLLPVWTRLTWTLRRRRMRSSPPRPTLRPPPPPLPPPRLPRPRPPALRRVVAFHP